VFCKLLRRDEIGKLSPYLHHRICCVKIKRFIGTSENAVKIQIIIAMIAYLLLGMARKLAPTKRSLQQLARLVSVNLMQRRNIIELLGDKSPPPKRKSKTNLHQLMLIHA